MSKGSTSTLCADVAPRISEMIKGAKQAAGMQMKAVAAAIITMLLQMGIAREEDGVANECVLTHPCNRFGVGVIPSDMWKHLLQILVDGFVWTEINGRAVAFDIAKGIMGENQISKNVEWQAASMGTLPSVNRDRARLLSVCGGHTKEVLKAIHDACLGCTDPTLCGADGRLIKERVYQRCPSIQDPVDRGLKWIVIPSQLEACVPELPAFLQEAGNIGQGTHTKITKTQALLQAHQRGFENLLQSGEYNWPLVIEHLERTNQHLKDMGEAIVDFAKEWSGGNPPIFLQEIERFCKLMSVSKDVGPAVWQLLAKAPLKEFPEYVIAMVKAALAAPEQFCHKGESRLITASEIASLSSGNKAKVVEATLMMRTMRKYCREMDLSQAEHEKIYGDAQCRMVMTIHKKNV